MNKHYEKLAGNRDFPSVTTGTQAGDTKSDMHLPRQIVVFEPEVDRALVNRLRRDYAIRNIAHTSDFQVSSWQAEQTGDANLVVFDHLGMGLLAMDDPDRMASLMRLNHRNRPFYVVRPELNMSVLRSYGEESYQWRMPFGSSHDNPERGSLDFSPLRAGASTPMVKGFEDNQRYSWAMRACGITQARQSGRGVKIAILDTGLDFLHMDWANRPVSHRSFVGPSAQDEHGHGTQCAGLAAGGSIEKGVPRFGSAPLADLYVGKVLKANGRGPDSAILAGIDWAIAQGCQVLSLSVGVQTEDALPDPVYELVGRRCLRSGTLFIAAAGNDSARPIQVRPVCRPANCPSIFAVGAVDRFMRLANFTNGTCRAGQGQIDAVAPGVDVLTTCMGPARYGRFSGTSMAAPLCAGLAALLVQEDPDCLGTALWQKLASVSKRLALPSTDVGFGLVSFQSHKKHAW